MSSTEVAMLLLLFSMCVRQASSTSHFIAVRDYKFEGEDRGIIAELTRRQPEIPNTAFKQVEPYPYMNLPPILLEDDVEKFLNESARKHAMYKNYPKDYTVRIKLLDMIRQTLYATQYRLEVMEAIVERYKQSEKFRLGYMYAMVAEWLYDMQVFWTAGSKHNKKPLVGRFRVYKQILYYEQQLRRNVDITYTVEEIIRVHDKLFKEMKDDEELKAKPKS